MSESTRRNARVQNSAASHLTCCVSPHLLRLGSHVPHRQYKVTPDDLIITEKLSGVDVNDRIRLNKVLLLGNKTETVIGRPAVEGASVVALVEEQFLDGKVLVFKKRRRKNSRRLNGHRQPLTSLRVIDIEGPFSTTCW